MYVFMKCWRGQFNGPGFDRFYCWWFSAQFLNYLENLPVPIIANFYNLHNCICSTIISNFLSENIQRLPFFVLLCFFNRTNVFSIKQLLLNCAINLWKSSNYYIQNSFAALKFEKKNLNDSGIYILNIFNSKRIGCVHFRFSMISFFCFYFVL